MKRIITLWGMIICYALNATAQTQTDYAWGIPSTGPVIMHDLELDPNGDVIEVGFFAGNVQLDPNSTSITFQTSGTNDYDIVIRKMDHQGNFIWAQKLGNAGDLNQTAFEVESDLSGNIYITGFFSMPMDMDPGPAVYTLNTLVGKRFLLKLNAQGVFQWAINLPTENQWNGNELTQHRLAVDQAGNVYVAGLYYQIFDFDPGPNVENLSGDCYILKLNSAGQYVWARSYEIAINGEFGDLAIDVDSLGNVGLASIVYLNNSYYLPMDSIDIDPGPGVFNISNSFSWPGNIDLMVTTLDVNGSLNWGKLIKTRGIRFNGATPTIKWSKKGHLFFTGCIELPGTFSIQQSIYKYSNTGMELKSFHQTDGFQMRYIGKMFVDDEENIYYTTATFRNGYMCAITKVDSNFMHIWSRPLIHDELYFVSNVHGIELSSQNVLFMNGYFMNFPLGYNPQPIPFLYPYGYYSSGATQFLQNNGSHISSFLLKWQQINASAVTSCMPTFNYNYPTPNYVGDLKINGVPIDELNMISSSDEERYRIVWPYSAIELNNNSNNTLLINKRPIGPNATAGFWIDFNKDGDFDDLLPFNENIGVLNNINYTSFSNINVHIPDSSTQGYYTMRIRIMNAGGIPTPCSYLPDASTEDVIFFIKQDSVALSCKAFLEGFYASASGNSMYPVLLNQGQPGATSQYTDSVQLELYNSTPPFQQVFSKKVLVSTQGMIQLKLSPDFNKKQFYLVIKHRNSIETWSSIPVFLNDNTLYDFTTSASKAYGNNMIQLNNAPTFGFYSGDCNQDGVVDGLDFILWENNQNAFNSVDLSTDLNGDGTSDGLDFLYIETNGNNLIGVQRP